MKYIGFGAGSNLQYMNKLFLNRLSYIVDSDPKKWGGTSFGVKVLSPAVLKEEDKSNVFIFILSTAFHSDISLELKDMGYIGGANYTAAIDWNGNDDIPEAYVTNQWTNHERTVDFEKASWEQRARKISKMIDFTYCRSVMDLGAGDAFLLKKFLKAEVTYYPVDYIKRNEAVLVADFNKYEFPQIRVDYIIMSGVLEYLLDWKWFIATAAALCNDIILTYIPLESNGNIVYRRSRGWVNNLRLPELIIFMQSKGLTLVDSDNNGDSTILKFSKNIF